MSKNIVNEIKHDNFQALQGISCWSYLKKWTIDDKYVNKQVVCFINQTMYFHFC